MTQPRRFAFRYGIWRPLLSVLGLGPKFSDIAVTPDEVRVRMGWGFRARIPRSSIRSAAPDEDMWGSVGVHGWRGRWLLNGSVHGIVTIRIDPDARARTMGIPVRLHTLHVSVVEPDLLSIFLSS
ncbi:MAG: hypothetical protein GY929_08725 [Actinomycetia bacterium]|nr:hypothetical protein [Actinomycetes bacterium]